MTSDKSIETPTNQELARTIDWSTVKTFDDLQAVFASAGIDMVDSYTYGDGFELLKDKSLLMNKPFVVCGYALSNSGDFGDFAVLRVLTGDNKKFVFTDGSTGVGAQVKRLGDKMIGLVVKEGLIASDYTYYDEKLKKDTPARTYYISGIA